MAAAKKKDRVLGPYPRRDKWRLVIVGGDDGRRTYRDYPTQAKALAFKVALSEKLALTAGTTFADAIEQYEQHLTAKGNKAGPIADTIWRLGRVFAEPSATVASLTKKEDGQALYTKLQAYRNERTGKGYAPDSHRNMIIEARTFLRWCVEKNFTKSNALEGVVGMGSRKKGADKPQLRIDEARKWMARALELAKDDHEGATAALMTVLLGVRCSEAVSRQVRDLDDGGRLLWIPDSKTEAGRRTLEIPKLLQRFLRRTARGKAGTAFLLGDGKVRRDRNYPTKWCKKICRLAGVPVVGAHAMRRLHSTLAVAAGATGHLVAASLGHTSFSVTQHSYVARGTEAKLQQQRTLEILDGGRHDPHRAEDDDPDDRISGAH